MPVLSKGKMHIDYTDEGQGLPVILIHSSVSGNGQWRSMTEHLKDCYRVLAINLFGYGETTPWPRELLQPLYAQAQLVSALCNKLDDPIRLVGHSFGGSVALKSALALGSRVESLVLLEPNPFNLLRQSGRSTAFLEAQALREHVKCFGALGDWASVAEGFSNYWMGDGSWDTMPVKRRDAFVKSLPPNYSEWDAVMEEQTTIADLKTLTPKTLVVSDKSTQHPIREIVEIFAQECPHWSFRYIAEGGHMAPLTHPEIVNPIVREFFDTV